jgi:oligosaccharide reducing-end xylanase
MAKGKGAFHTGSYRNLFIECGIEEKAIRERIAETWRSLFEGPETQRIYFEAGADMGYLLDTGNLDVRTEGMSYGMMMAVQMDRKDVFDRIWKWAFTHMYMTEGKHAGYFAWSCKPDGARNSNGPAPDGEEYFALALFFASHRWGEGPAPFDYGAKARAILGACLHNGEGGVGHPMWNPNNKLIKFIPEFEFSDPSYHLPHFYELFALWADESDRAFWKEAAEASRRYLPVSCHPVTGLAPEYAYYDGRPNDEKGYGKFFSDSYRVAANVGLDWEWFAASEWERDEADRLIAFFADKRSDDFRRYQIDGTPLEEKSLHPVGLVATNAEAALAAHAEGDKGRLAREAALRLWNTPPRTGERRYYDNCLYFFAMLALSGNYRIWMPKE